LAVLIEGTEKTVKNWVARREEKKVADEARRKLQDEGKAYSTPPPVEEKLSAPSRAVTSKSKAEKPAKPSKALFTGEAEPEPAPEPAPVDDGDDMVAMAEAEAKPP